MLNVNFPPEINNFTSTQEDILKILVQRLFRLKASAQGGNGEDEKKKKNTDVVARHEAQTTNPSA